MGTTRARVFNKFSFAVMCTIVLLRAKVSTLAGRLLCIY